MSKKKLQNRKEEKLEGQRRLSKRLLVKRLNRLKQHRLRNERRQRYKNLQCRLNLRLLLLHRREDLLPHLVELDLEAINQM